MTTNKTTIPATATRHGLTRTQFRAISGGTPYRVFLYDCDTRQEIGAYTWFGNGEAGIRDGVRYLDTRTCVTVLDWEGRDLVDLQGSDFPGRRVAVKFWAPEGFTGQRVEWWLLVGGLEGWQGNEVATRETRTGTWGRRKA